MELFTTMFDLLNKRGVHMKFTKILFVSLAMILFVRCCTPKVRVKNLTFGVFFIWQNIAMNLIFLLNLK